MINEQYNSLGPPKPIKYPLRCNIGTEVIITDLHPADENFENADIYCTLEGILMPTAPAKLYIRNENCGLKEHRETYAAVNIKIGDKIIYFNAVRFVRKTQSLAMFYRLNPKRKVKE